MVLNQTMMPAQVVPNMWGVWQGVIEGLSLLGSTTCPASWPASLVEWVDQEPAKRTTLGPPVTQVKCGSCKTAARSSGKKSLQKQIPDFWDDPEREREEEESRRLEEERCHKKSSGSPILSLAEHEELVSSLVTKTAPNWVSQPISLPSQVVAVTPEIGKDQGKARQPSPKGVNSSDDEPLPDKGLDPKPKGCKWDYTSPDLVVLDDDDSPLSSTNRKTLAKKAKTYMEMAQRTMDRLTLQLKSEGCHCQYSKELANLTKYWNEKVPDLRKAPNMDDHLVHFATVKKKSWGYPAKGNLQTMKQFMQDLYGCVDEKKIERREKMLRDRRKPGIPEDVSVQDGKREHIKARYMMRVLRSIEGEILDLTRPDCGREQNIGLHDIVSLESMNWIKKNGQLVYGGKTFSRQVDAGYCPLCPYSCSRRKGGPIFGPYLTRWQGQNHFAASHDLQVNHKEIGDLHYQPGKRNPADPLSRINWSSIESHMVKATFDLAQVDRTGLTDAQEPRGHNIVSKGLQVGKGPSVWKHQQEEDPTL